MSDLDRALDLLLDHEGGWSNRAADRGGATMFGITQATYDAWRKSKGRPPQSVRLATPEEARDLYEAEYWLAAGCDRLPWPISYLTFDAAVNSGPSRAVSWLQQGLGVLDDAGKGLSPRQRVGPVTQAAAARAANDPARKLAIVQARRDFLDDVIRKDASLLGPLGGTLPPRAQIHNLGGWWARTLDVLATALAA